MSIARSPRLEAFYLKGKRKADRNEILEYRWIKLIASFFLPVRGVAIANKTSIARELLSECISQGWIGKTPANRATALIAATVTTLRGYSMSSVKVVHGRQLRTEPARRHGYVHKMWKILLDFFNCLSVPFDHTSFSNENHHFNLDVDQSAADRPCLFFAVMALSSTIEEWRPISTEPPPFWADLELAVIDHEGPHALIFPCRRISGGFMKIDTKGRIDVRPTHWRYWRS